MRRPQLVLTMAQPLVYRIEVQGRIEPRWFEWFEGMEIQPVTREDAAVKTSLSGTLPDQAALLGLLLKLYDRGYVLLQVVCLELERERTDRTPPGGTARKEVET